MTLDKYHLEVGDVILVMHNTRGWFEWLNIFFAKRPYLYLLVYAGRENVYWLKDNKIKLMSLSKFTKYENMTNVLRREGLSYYYRKRLINKLHEFSKVGKKGQPHVLLDMAFESVGFPTDLYTTNIVKFISFKYHTSNKQDQFIIIK